MAARELKFWICLFLLPVCLFGQSQIQKKLPAVTQSDTLQKTEPKHSPRKATLLSLLPGAGQVYNRKYWKVPVIYAAFAGLSYLIIVNDRGYRTFYNDEKNYTGAETDLLFIDYQTNKNDYLHALNLDEIGVLAVYVLNLIDAAVDAHLYTFDIGKDLSLKICPAFLYTAQNNLPSTGLGISLKF